jgi:acyl-homoserine-lactone acylase
MPGTTPAPFALAAALLLAACAAGTVGTEPRTATIQRTTHGVAHVTAPDMETLAYGVAYAHAQDNVCQTAEHLVTARGERSRYFGGDKARGALGLRVLPNEQIDFFVAAHMDDAALARAYGAASADARAMLRGYVAGYNRYLADNAGKLPKACSGQPWVQPMTAAEFLRFGELTMVQAGIAAVADGMVAAKPPTAAKADAAPASLEDAVAVAEEMGLKDPPIGSNGWAFGRDVTANGRGVLLGNPHFPWVGVNRFWQMHVTIPGELDSMGAATGHFAVPSIGFNKDIAWTHTVSTGKRFTLHELTLVNGDPTSYVVDGRPEKMTAQTVQIAVRGADGQLVQKQTTVWKTRFGPVVVIPRAGLNWTATNAYALKDANTLNARWIDAWLAINRARSVAEVRDAHATLGIPWVNTLAVDRHGNAMYGDVSVVPDVDAAQLARCAPSKQAAALFGAAGLPVLDGSRSECDWRRDPASPVPGLTPIARMPVLIRGDWVQNSNDSFYLTNPAYRFDGISPMVGTPAVSRPRTRIGIIEIREMVAAGKVDMPKVQQALYSNRNYVGSLVMGDLLAACPGAPTAEARDGCAALAGWDRTSNADAKGAHVFREFWRRAATIPGVWRVPLDPADPINTPSGLKTSDDAVRARLWEAMGASVKAVRDAGFPLDAPLGTVQAKRTSAGPIAIHGGDEFEGVLNKVETRATGGITKQGLDVDYGTSYLQTVTFDERGPIAHAVLTFGQSTNPDSPHATDQMRVFSQKQWPALPFHPEDVAKARIGEVVRLQRP